MEKQTQIVEQELQDLKRHYEEAVKNGQETFDWHGQTVLTKYAYYLIEYYK